MLLEADDDKTKPPDSSPNNAENPLLGIETTNENCEKIEHEMENDDDDQKQADPQKASEASANKLEMFQEKQKFIEEQNRKRKEMLSKVNLKLFADYYQYLSGNSGQAKADRPGE